MNKKGLGLLLMIIISCFAEISIDARGGGRGGGRIGGMRGGGMRMGGRGFGGGRSFGGGGRAFRGGGMRAGGRSFGGARRVGGARVAGRSAGVRAGGARAARPAGARPAGAGARRPSTGAARTGARSRSASPTRAGARSRSRSRSNAANRGRSGSRSRSRSRNGNRNRSRSWSRGRHGDWRGRYPLWAAGWWLTAGILGSAFWGPWFGAWWVGNPDAEVVQVATPSYVDMRSASYDASRLQDDIDAIAQNIQDFEDRLAELEQNADANQPTIEKLRREIARLTALQHDLEGRLQEGAAA